MRRLRIGEFRLFWIGSHNVIPGISDAGRYPLAERPSVRGFALARFQFVIPIHRCLQVYVLSGDQSGLRVMTGNRRRSLSYTVIFRRFVCEWLKHTTSIDCPNTLHRMLETIEAAAIQKLAALRPRHRTNLRAKSA
jgi:hypothetical protein